MGAGVVAIGVTMPRDSPRYSSRCKAVFGVAGATGIDVETATFRGFGTPRFSGTYSLILRVRLCPSARSPSSSEERAESPWYIFLRGEPGDEDSGGYNEGPRPDCDEIEDPLDLVLEMLFQDSNAPITGDGRGVMSSIAAICGEDMTEPGDIEPAVECSAALTLGARRGRLAAEALVRSL
jgi:hypothetical protein